MVKSMVQVSLVSGSSRRVCWVEDGVRVGNNITLKNSEDRDRLWRVEAISAPKDVSEINRGWRVGGL